MPQHPLLQVVQRTRRLWNRRTATEAAGWLVAAILSALLVGAAVDYLFRFTDRGLRILLSLTVASALAAAAWLVIRHWRKMRWSDFHAAMQIQEKFPQLGDRVASSVEFLRQDEQEGAAGSLALRRAVVLDATASLQQLPATDVARRKSPARVITLATLLVLVVALLGLFAPQAARTALARLALPWSNVEWPRHNSLAFVDPPTLLAKGETFEVALIDERGNLPTDVRIEYRYQFDGHRQSDSEPMQRVGDTYIARREKVTREFQYRATGGDHQTMPWHVVRVVDPPSLESLEIVVHPPEYTGLSASPLEGASRVIADSTLSLAGISNVPLKQARLEFGQSDPLPLKLATPTRLELPPGEWRARLAQGGERQSEFQIRLEGSNGLVGTSPTRQLRIVEDPAPQVAWLEPHHQDLYVLPTARITAAAEVADNLAIANVDLHIGLPQPAPEEGATDAGHAEFDGTEGDTQERLLLYSLASPPPLESLPATGILLDKRQFSRDVLLAPYDLAPGNVVTLEVKATDFRPGEGRTRTQRRLTIISTAELESRLASQQADILRRVEQALEDQRSARNQADEALAMAPADSRQERERIDRLVRTRSQQQKVRGQLTAPRDGVIALVGALRQQLAINQVERPELSSQLDTIEQAIAGLDARSLPDAEQRLTDIRKHLEEAMGGSPPENPSLARSATPLKAAQEEIIATLERLVEQAAEWSDADRFVRELARLETLERQLAAATAAAALRQAQARSRQQELPKEETARLALQQAEITRRTEKLLAAMRKQAQQPDRDSELAERLADAVAAADRDELTRSMAAASRDAENTQLGRAAETQQQAADTLAELLSLLRSTTPTDPEQLAKELRRLAQQLREQQQQLENAENKSDEERKSLSEELSRLARQLNRMTAPAASQSTQQAASQTAPRPGETPEQKQQRADQARQQLRQAELELAERLAELQQQQQQRLLERLAIVLEELIPRQQEIIATTLRLQDAAMANEEGRQKDDYETVSREQSEIAEELSGAIADLAARAVFQLSLRGAEGDMRQAATALGRQDPGHLTQQLELAALARMRHVLDVLREPPPTPNDPQENQENQGEGGDQGQQGPRRPPIIELAEAKMLRWLQVELNGRTRLLEADLADNPQERENKQDVARRLAEEQRQLEALVREMMERADDPEPPLENL